MKHTILESFTIKNSLQNLAKFHDGIFELEILGIFTTVLSLKTIQKSSQKTCKQPKKCISRNKRKFEKKKEKRKI